MHQPRPHGQLAVGAEPTADDAATVERLTRRLTNLRDLSGVASLRMVQGLPDGGHVLVQDMGGVLRTITYKPAPPAPPPPFDGLARDYVPMLYSGAITKSVVFPGQGVGMTLTEQARRRIANYDPASLPPKNVALQRFEVEYHPDFSEFLPDFDTPMLFTQYAQLRPTWYSGAMAEVMQIVGGYGRQILAALPDTALERARFILPPHVVKGVRDELGENLRLPGYTGLPDAKGQCRYDYKFSRNHGVGFDGTDRPWLFRIASNGVYAMPLPLVPATTTAAFRTHIEQVGDEELLVMLDRFGGMPSGETFPADPAAFEAWRRAGVISKVCEAGDFYQHLAYATACGWSFNSSGQEGVNTCYDYDDTGWPYGLTYKARLRFGAAPNYGRLPPALKPDDPDEARRLDNYLSQLYRMLGGNRPQDLAIKYKLRRVPPADLLARATDGTVTQAEVHYWDALTLPPIAAHSGSLTQIARGPLLGGGEIKYPEPLFGGCVSFDFRPLEGSSQPRSSRCDTIMFAYYLADQLKVVKYFNDPGKYQKEVESDYDDCMTVGSWTKVETSGDTTLYGNFYTTDFDDRKEMAPDVTVTRIVGKDRGYGPAVAQQDVPGLTMAGSVSRRRYYQHDIDVQSVGGQNMAVACCVPYFCRDAVIHAYRESHTGKSRHRYNSSDSVVDPYFYRYWTYDFITHWWGPAAPPAKGRPLPDELKPVWVENEQYSPGPCTDFADSGPWMVGLPQDISAWYRQRVNGGNSVVIFKPYSTSSYEPGKQEGNLKADLLGEPVLVHKQVPDNWYFTVSPEPILGLVFYRDACRVAIGKTIYANLSEYVGPRRALWGHTSLVDHLSAHHFIGVINE